MSRFTRAMWLTFRAAVIALSLLVAVTLWYGPNMTWAHPSPPAGPDAHYQLAAMQSESWGLFPYYARAVSVYRTGDNYQNVEMDSGILLSGLAITIAGFLMLVCVVVTAVKPSIAKNSIRRLTTRWSVP